MYLFEKVCLSGEAAFSLASPTTEVFKLCNAEENLNSKWRVN